MEELMLTSGFNFEGYKITQYIGFYSGECALGTGFLSSLDAGIADFLGSNSDMYEEKLSKAKSMAISELKNLAVAHGANAIIGVDVDYTSFSSDIMGVVANGTAVKIEEIQNNSYVMTKLGKHIKRDEKYAYFPIINYYEKLTIRPFRLTLDILTNGIKIFIYNYKEEKITALNVDIIANTIFGTVYEYQDINFVDFNIKDDVIETEEIFLNIENNQLKVIESMTVKINHYILGGETYSMDNSYQVSNMPVEQLLKFRESYGGDVVSDFQDNFSHWICMCGYKNDANMNKCLMCERNKGEYTRAKNVRTMMESLMPKLIKLHNCQEIYTYLKDIEQKNNFLFPQKVMEEIEKLTQMERMYGNMKDSLVNTLTEFISESE